MFSADRVEFRALDVRRMPKAITPEQGTFLPETPERAPVPFQVLANGPEHIRSDSGKVIGLGQDAGHGILRRHTLLAALALGDVSNRPDKHQRLGRIFLRGMAYYFNILD